MVREIDNSTNGKTVKRELLSAEERSPQINPDFAALNTCAMACQCEYADLSPYLELPIGKQNMESRSSVGN
jgi:hypothetical protein